ncbi:MAG: hypothetical protein ABFS12_04345 [Bacteroidota bacterium]
MKIYLISFLLITFIACNSADEPKADLSKDSTENKQLSKSVNVDKEEKPAKSDSNIVPNIIEDNGKLSNNKVQSISDLWETYKSSKSIAEENFSDGDFSSMIKNYEISANAAIGLSREDLAAWQLNNIGHFSIEEFMKRTDYNDRVRKLAIETDPIEKSTYFKETKNIFKKDYKLLLDAEPHLKRASRLDRKYKFSNRTKTIRNNINFIKWVREFLKTKVAQ